jgi:23S rRNA pseudouridine2605 synthase
MLFAMRASPAPGEVPHRGGRHASAGPPGRKELVRVLSRSGLCSRRAAEELVRAGRVSVDGRVTRDPGRPTDARREAVRVDGAPLVRAATVCIALNKPTDYVTSASDERGRATVYDLLHDVGAWVVPVGRLDRDTTGLLLLTNDTRLADHVTDPRTHLAKTYRARTARRLSDEELDALRAGVVLDDGPTRPARVRRVEGDSRGTRLEIVLTEGRNRQVRRMVAAVGGSVVELARVSVGPLALGELAPGRWRTLTEDELAALRQACDLRGRDGQR